MEIKRVAIMYDFDFNQSNIDKVNFPSLVDKEKPKD